MGLETATYLDGLVATNPTAGDPRSRGDDHLRLIKEVLKNTFPSLVEAVKLAGFGRAGSVTFNAGGTTTVQTATKQLHYTTATGATTWVFSGPAAAGEVTAFYLELTNGGAGVQTWPASVVWMDNEATPALQASGKDFLFFMTRDGGTTWLGVNLRFEQITAPLWTLDGNTYVSANPIRFEAAVTFASASPEEVSPISPGATVNLDASLGDLYTLTPSGDFSITLSNLAAGHRFRLQVDNNGSAKQITFSTGWENLQWPLTLPVPYADGLLWERELEHTTTYPGGVGIQALKSCLDDAGVFKRLVGPSGTKYWFTFDTTATYTEVVSGLGTLEVGSLGQVKWNGAYWVVGFSSGGFATNEVRYSNDGLNWVEPAGTPIWSARYNVRPIVFGGKLWLFGGKSSDLFTGTYESGAFSTTDGVNWVSSAFPGVARGYIYPLVVGPDLYLFGGYNGSYSHPIYKSSDGGASWTSILAVCPFMTDVNTQVLFHNSRFYAFDTSGVWTSSDAVSWTLVNAATPYYDPNMFGGRINGGLLQLAAATITGTSLEIWTLASNTPATQQATQPTETSGVDLYEFYSPDGSVIRGQQLLTFAT